MTGDIFSAIAALLFVLGLLGLFAWAVKRFGFIPGQPKFIKSSKELEIIESKMVDARNKLFVARWRGTDYLLSAGPSGISKIDKQEASKQATTNAQNSTRGVNNDKR